MMLSGAFSTPTIGALSISKGKTLDKDVLTVYLAFIAVAGVVVEAVEFNVGLSTLPTLSVALQILALAFLHLKIQRTRSVAGVSGRSLIMQVAVHMLRLCSTTWLKGYIPSDPTGDFLYQILDVVMVVMCLFLISRVFKTFRHTYQEEQDDCDIKLLTLGCFILAILVHPDLNDRVLFDTTWAASLYIDVFAMLPQLWMMSKIGGKVEALTGHYVAAIGVSRLANFVFWFYGFKELAPMVNEEAQEFGMNLPGWFVLGAHVIQLLLMCDFMFFYMKAYGCSGRTGLGEPIDISGPSLMMEI